MGSGKSTLGKLLSKRLGVEFYDADAVFEAEAGLPVPEFFRLNGEEAFRRREREILAAIVERPGSAVVATGGGAFCRTETREQLLRCAVTVFLRVGEDELVRRLERTEIAARPVLAGGDWRGRVAELVRTRYPFYEMAEYVIDIGNEDPADTVGRLERLLDSAAPGENAC